MIRARRSGFLAGYRGKAETPPKRLSKADRLVWLAAWAEGSTLARRHRAELVAAYERASKMKEPT